MIRTTRMVTECQCMECGIIHLLGQTFDGQRCCGRPRPKTIGKRRIVEYTKTVEEEKAEVLKQMQS